MASPVLPADFRALISDPGASLCGNFKNTLLKLPLLVYQAWSWLVSSDGNLSTEVQKSISILTVKPGDYIISAGLLNVDGRLLCDGQAYSRTDYADLFAAIGTTYGVGNGTTTFNVPDCRDKFPIGVSGSKTIGTTGGDAEITLIKSQMPVHSHGMRASLSTNGSSGSAFGWADNTSIGFCGRKDVVTDIAEDSVAGFGTGNVAAGNPIKDNGSGMPHSNIPPYMAVYWYVKT